MLSSRLAILACLALLGACQSTPPVCQPAPKPAAAANPTQWTESTLSECTKDKVKAAIEDYNQCLTRQTQALAAGQDDPRSIANTILKDCEQRLAPIKDAYAAEQVPDAISQRHQRQVRSRGAQRVLLAVMAVHAQRAGEEEEAKQAAQQKTPQ